MEVKPGKTPSPTPILHTTTPEKRVLGLLGTKNKVFLNPVLHSLHQEGPWKHSPRRKSKSNWECSSS